MPLLSRKKPTSDVPADAPVLTKPGGKNRATPSRADARAARPVTPYMKGSGRSNRRQASGSAKEQRQTQYAASRAAMKGQGDLRDLPTRDQGAEKAFVRSYVDTRRNLLTLILAAYALMILTFVFHNSTIVYTLLITIMFVALVDALVLSFQVKRALRKEFPGTTQRVSMYAIQRGIMPRRYRMPRPGVGIPARR